MTGKNLKSIAALLVDFGSCFLLAWRDIALLLIIDRERLFKNPYRGFVIRKGKGPTETGRYGQVVASTGFTALALLSVSLPTTLSQSPHRCSYTTPPLSNTFLFPSFGLDSTLPNVLPFKSKLLFSKFPQSVSLFHLFPASTSSANRPPLLLLTTNPHYRLPRITAPQ